MGGRIEEGSLMGDPKRRMSISRNGNVACPCRLIPPCHMSNLTKIIKKKKKKKNGTIIVSPCHMSLSPISHVEFKKCPCRPVDFRGLMP